MSSMNEFFKAKKTGETAKEASKSDKARSEGDIDKKRYRNYYDINNTITTAQTTDPNDQDNVNYNQEQVFVSLERNAEELIVSNDGNDTLFVIVSHEGGQNFARERPIYPGENKTYYNIYELRLRSPTQGLPYRVTEYPICCIDRETIPIQKALIHNQALPNANTNFIVASLSPVNVPTTFRIQIGVSIAGTFNVIITNGGNSQILTLNSTAGPALTAGALYIFDVLVDSGDTINFQYTATGGTIQVLRVQEIDTASA